MRLLLLLLLLVIIVVTGQPSGDCSTLQCSDGLLCNGAETCNNGRCEPPSSPFELMLICEASSHPLQCGVGYCNSASQSCASYADFRIGNPCGISNIGRCRVGTLQCDPDTGRPVCIGRIDPRSEGTTVNGVDDDCNGIVDDFVVTPCSSVRDCQSSTDCIETSCINGFCIYLPKNLNQQCQANGSPCLGPYFCNSNGQCLARSDVACATSPYASDPTQRADCLVTKCVTGQCISARWIGPCDDSNTCTVNDACSSSGTCIGTPINCNDRDPCTMDTCRNGTCIHETINGCGVSIQAQTNEAAAVEGQTYDESDLVEPAADFDDPNSGDFWLLVVMIPVAVCAIVFVVGVVIWGVIVANRERQAAEGQKAKRKKKTRKPKGETTTS